MAVLRLVPVQILHIVIVILVRRIQQHMKIAHVKPGFFDPAYYRPESAHRKASERPLKRLRIRAQIQKRRHRHISADPAFAFQI